MIRRIILIGAISLNYVVGQDSIVPKEAEIDLRVAKEGQAKAMAQVAGKEKEAASLYLELLREKPDQSLKKELPFLLTRAGEKKQAATAFEALGINRLSAGDFWVYLESLKATGQLPKMEAAMEERIIQKGNCDMLTAYVANKREFNRIREAIPTLKKAIERYPTNERIATTSAEAASELGDTALTREILDTALKNNPGASKLYVIAARVEEIDRQPKKAVELLQKAINLEPTNAEPRRIAYRLLMNEDRLRRAGDLMDPVFSPSVDSLLILATKGLTNTGSGKSPYELYESLQTSSDPKIQAAIKSLASKYQCQKAAWLEMKGISTLRAGDHAKAIKCFNQLRQMEPNNATALYGKAEAQRASNDTAGAQETYTLLVQSYPTDRTAAGALKEIQDSRRPSIRSIFQLDTEDAPGRLANIVQGSWYTAYRWEATKNLVLTAGPKGWIMAPKGGPTYTAEGGTIEALLRINNALSVSGFITAMGYNQSSAKSNITAGLDAAWKATSKLELGAGLGRENVVHNEQNITQGTQVDVIRASAKYKVNPYIVTSVGARMLRYTDNNLQAEATAKVEGTIIKKPGELKVSAAALGINTQHQTVYGTNQGKVKYPYWTPKKYLQATAALSWEQNLAPYAFAGQNELSYGAQVFVSYDTTDNLLLGAGAHIRWEAVRNLIIEAGVLTERSKAWNGCNAYLSTEYKF